MDRTTFYTVTRERVWTLTTLSVALYVVLSLVFADGLFTSPFWNGASWINSPLITYFLILAIVLAGWAEARRIPENGIPLRLDAGRTTPGQIQDPASWRLLTGNTYFALLWLPLRFFAGRNWLENGWQKVGDPDWMNGGDAVKSFWERAVAIPESGMPRILPEHSWYRDFLNSMLGNGWYGWVAKVIAWGETLIGLGLLVGALVGLTAFFGTLLNFNYLLAGSAGANPELFGIGVLLILAWKVAGYWGLDRWILPALGAPWVRAEAQVEAVARRAKREAGRAGAPGLP